MQTVLLKQSHEDKFLEQGWLLALAFKEGWACFRVQQKEWSNLEPFSLGGCAAQGNLVAWSEVQDAQTRRYLEPPVDDLIYHTFWGVTPAPARIYLQYPPRSDIGNMLEIPRTITGDIGYIDGNRSPFNGPFSEASELITINERYPAFQVYNPLPDAMYNVMLKFDQRQYTYIIIKNRPLISSMLVGSQRVKKYTMGQAYSNPMNIPKWLSDDVGAELLKYSLEVMEGVTS